MKKTETHIYFWGGIFSQWYKSSFIYIDKDKSYSFNSAEGFMMYKKALLFKDYKIAREILKTLDPKKQKQLGRKIKNFDQKIWDDNKLDIVVQGNLLKFSQNKELKKELLNTNDKILVEGSPYDTVWGVGLKWDDPKILDSDNWKGENLLGVALMEVRSQLKMSNTSISSNNFNNLLIKSVNQGTDYIKGKLMLKSENVSYNENFKEINGSILDAKEDIIAQGCNCKGASGSGIAKYIAKKFPKSDLEYKKLCKNKLFNLGNVLFFEENSKIIANCATQINYGRYLKMDKISIESRYLAVEVCLLKIYNEAKKRNLSVALPRIGCGRARLDWNRVKKIIQEVFSDYPVTIYFIEDSYTKGK